MTNSQTPRRHERRLTLAIAMAATVAIFSATALAQKPGPEPLRQQAIPTNVPPSPTPVTAPAGPAPPPASTTEAASHPEGVTLNFQGADLQAVTKAVSQMTGRNFLIDPRAKGQITIISAKPVSSATAYQIFVSALKAQGFAVIEGPGNLVKIVPSAEARQHAPVHTNDGAPGGGEQMITHVVIVQNGSAAQMVPLLRPLMAPTSQLSSFDAANALIITDYADNVRRMLRIVEKIDQPVNSDVNIIALQYASALDIADMLTRLSLPGIVGVGQPGQIPGASGNDRFSIVPDMRTNSLLVRADNPGRINQLRSLVAKLDVPATTGGNTRVVYLRNADAVKLAEVLRGLIAGEARAQQTVASVGAALAPGTARAATGRGAEASLIQADEATNALIINASDAVYNNLRAVIEKLDVRRAQVYVEALIVEMTDDNALQLGFQWAGGRGAGPGTVGAVQNFTSANPGIVAGTVSPSTAFTTASGLTLAYLGRQITLPNGSVITSLGALARALDESNLANILSTPNLMTLDNAEAKIVVGQNVPFVTGSFAQAAGAAGVGAVNPFQTIERKDVGLTLKIKPQISEGGTIRLDIYQEVSNVSSTTVSGASDLITNKRSIDTKVIVDDGHTIVLGGLIQDQTNETQQAVPLLGRIPLLGALFRYRETKTTKTNLMVFLRPLVIRSAEDGYRITSDRYEYLRPQTTTRQNEEVLNRLTPKRPTAEKDGLLGPSNVPDEFSR